jgi:hypothetical protein
MAANLAPTGGLISEVADLRGVRECLQWFTRERVCPAEVRRRSGFDALHCFTAGTLVF